MILGKVRLRYGGRLLHGVILLLAFTGVVWFFLTGGYAILISTGIGTDPVLLTEQWFQLCSAKSLSRGTRSSFFGSQASFPTLHGPVSGPLPPLAQTCPSKIEISRERLGHRAIHEAAGPDCVRCHTRYASEE